jgi:hypothetical protein
MDCPVKEQRKSKTGRIPLYEKAIRLNRISDWGPKDIELEISSLI